MDVIVTQALYFFITSFFFKVSKITKSAAISPPVAPVFH